MSQLVVASFHYLIFSHLGANMPNGTLYVSSRARRSIHVSARRIQVYCQAMMSMSDPDVPALCLITVNNSCLDVPIESSPYASANMNMWMMLFVDWCGMLC